MTFFGSQQQNSRNPSEWISTKKNLWEISCQFFFPVANTEKILWSLNDVIKRIKIFSGSECKHAQHLSWKWSSWINIEAYLFSALKQIIKSWQAKIEAGLVHRKVWCRTLSISGKLWLCLTSSYSIYRVHFLGLGTYGFYILVTITHIESKFIFVLSRLSASLSVMRRGIDKVSLLTILFCSESSKKTMHNENDFRTIINLPPS